MDNEFKVVSDDLQEVEYSNEYASRLCCNCGHNYSDVWCESCIDFDNWTDE